MRFLPARATLVLFWAAFGWSAAPEYSYRVVRAYPHDPGAFTQGLEYHDGFLYEGTGLPGRSTLRKVKLETGQVLQEARLPAPLFGEGITILNGQVLQLTWQHQVGFVYGLSDFVPQRNFQYPGEGWGLTNDGQRIYMSDGTDKLRVWNGTTLGEVSRLTVHDGTQNVANLNELEWVRGEIWANVWQTDRIARISPADGHVTGWINLNALLPSADRTDQVDVLNGIAYDSASERIFVTGKLWPKLFEIKLIRRPTPRR